MTASLGLAEFVPLLIVLLQVILVVAVVIWSPRATAVDKEVIVRALSSDWIRRFTAELEALGGYEPSAPEENTVEIVRGRVPTWSLVIAILLFPMGLLALLAFRKDKATVSAHAADDGSTRIGIVGTLRNEVSDTIDRISSLLPL